MRKTSSREVLKAIDQGIRNAQMDYLTSYESYISSTFAPEYLITVYIYQSLLKLIQGYGLGLEVSVHELEELSHKKLSVNDAQRLRKNGYCDLLLRNLNDTPRVVIEVKKTAWEYYGDFERLKGLLSLGLEFSVFATCLFKETKDELKDELLCLQKEIEEYNEKSGDNHLIELEPSEISHLQLKGAKPDEDEERYWRPVVFKISNKPS